ncbi:carbohydrate ABC transporter permease [Catenulispora pinisilvae]|uniref:carbohydrate ABC transporter permease n=1 Tax=Catenulispora pinisilvae TaxID=2705253 RepID=UPI001E64000D|nr:sugar ABC transporter permease [Catenulispora pinisilvae]
MALPAAEQAAPPAGPAAPGSAGAAPGRRRRRQVQPYLLLIPAVVLLAAVVGYPLIRLGVISTQGFGLRTLITGRAASVGTANYTAILHDPQLLPVLVRTVVFAATLVAGTVVIGFGAALMMVAAGRKLRVAMMLALLGAWAMPTVASTLVWQWLFQPTYGVVNWLLTQLRVFGDVRQHDFLAGTTSGFVVVWLLVVWISVPFVALTLYAGLSQIPADYYEAAAIDGAGYLRRLRTVTVPFLRPVLMLVTVLSVIWDFNVFNQIWILTKGGPDGATTTIAIWSFTQAFASQSYGQGAAIAVFSVVLLAVLVGWWVRRLVVTGEEA